MGSGTSIPTMEVNLPFSLDDRKRWMSGEEKEELTGLSAFWASLYTRPGFEEFSQELAASGFDDEHIFSLPEEGATQYERINSVIDGPRELYTWLFLLSRDWSANEDSLNHLLDTLTHLGYSAFDSGAMCYNLLASLKKYLNQPGELPDAIVDEIIDVFLFMFKRAIELYVTARAESQGDFIKAHIVKLMQRGETMGMPGEVYTWPDILDGNDTSTVGARLFFFWLCVQERDFDAAAFLNDGRKFVRIEDLVKKYFASRWIVNAYISQERQREFTINLSFDLWREAAAEINQISEDVTYEELRDREGRFDAFDAAMKSQKKSLKDQYKEDKFRQEVESLMARIWDEQLAKAGN